MPEKLSAPMFRALRLAQFWYPRWIPRYDRAREWNPAYQTIEALAIRALVDACYFPPDGPRSDPNEAAPTGHPQPGDTVLWYRMIPVWTERGD